MTKWSTKSLSGWGRYPVIQAQCARPSDRDETISIVQDAPSPLISHGMGRSYGDAALLEDGKVILTRNLNHMLAFDEANGLLTCEAGVTLEEIINTFLPRGFFPPVVPGTQFVTIGGAIGCNIHGKNHHHDGCFGDHVTKMELLLANGDVVTVSPTEHKELFWATIGGMGLTGVILNATIKLTPVKSGEIDVETIRVENLDHFFEVSAESADFTHVVSWIDTVATGKNMGRGVFMRGRYSNSTATSESGGVDRLASAIGKLANGKSFNSNLLLNRFTVRAFNEAYFRKEKKGCVKSMTNYKPFFFPLDAVANWNYIYGPRGFLQYQFVVPSRDAVREALKLVSSSKEASFLSVIKEFGDKDHGGLSFPQKGITLAMDFPNTGKPLFKLFEKLDQLVLEAGGRIYLGKDARLPSKHVAAMYSDLDTWKDTRKKYDPDGLFASDLARRLDLL